MKNKELIPDGFYSAHQLYKRLGVKCIGFETFRSRLKSMCLLKMRIGNITYWKPGEKDIDFITSPVMWKRTGVRSCNNDINIHDVKKEEPSSIEQDIIQRNEMALKMKALYDAKDDYMTIRGFSGRVNLLTNGLVVMLTAANGSFKTWLTSELNIDEVNNGRNT